MMPSRFTLSFLTLALGAVSSAAMAVPYAFEARQEAMGGTGVASARGVFQDSCRVNLF